jgi:hypothetical protein
MFCNRDDCLCLVVEGTDVCEAGHVQTEEECVVCDECESAQDDEDILGVMALIYALMW